LGLIEKRENDMYPQGRENCKQFLRECQSRGYRFKVKTLKTKPYWTWYFELDSSSLPPAPRGFNLAPFSVHYDADQTWECSAGDCTKELGLIVKRENDMYPQGRDNCMQFLRECQSKGYRFRVKARKTSPYWTWYYEVVSGYQTPSYQPPAPRGFNLAPFSVHYDADQTWECSAGDCTKELGLIVKRENDMYPQGRDNCMQFLRECQSRGYRFRVKAKKTKPYWTWYYEVIA